jgi:hypothetical protein
MKFGGGPVQVQALSAETVRKAQISIVAFGINKGLERSEIADLVAMITPTDNFTTDVPRLSPAGP